MSKLYIVATPIGNLNDISARALSVLAESDLIAAEDTRHTRRLLDHYEIKQNIVALHDHNERRQSHLVVDRILAGEAVALVSDAGTPLISDPGYVLVQQARAAGIVVEPIPGPSALTAALSVSGLPTDQFQFLGFLPSKGREARIRAFVDYAGTLVLYEAPHRIENLLTLIVKHFGPSRDVVICRELTKVYEQVIDGPAEALLSKLAEGIIPARGEMVVLVAGRQSVSDSAIVTLDHCLNVLCAELPVSAAASLASRILGVKRNEAYKRALDHQQVDDQL
ncbi:MAG: 16S rRNA (cytidine(1402)-2'-O)-methyltransferase [Pseudomonadales bacterium]